MTPRTMRLATLGCKVNQYETQHVQEALELAGYRAAAEHEPADLCIVNTCTVTHEGDAKSRQLVRRLHQENPRAAIAVMGCYATRAPDEVKRLPGVTKVLVDKQRLLDDLSDFGVTRLPPGISRFDGHQRAFVKVQDGCLLNCSFCIIPKVRPVVRSRPIDEIVAEVSRLVDGGCPEIVLTGIHLGHYGIDLSRGRPKDAWSRLWHLIERLDELPGDFRIRLSSLEAAEVRGELVEALARSRRVVPHLHLCLQSGSDRILALMKRRYRAAGFRERCRRLRALLDQPAFTTDIIVGFPGETEEDFAATLQLAEDVGFSKMHIFSYSPRRGTAAVDLPERVPPEAIAERRERLRELEATLAQRYWQSLLGRRLDVLVETADPQRPGWVRGTSCRYVPVALEGRIEVLRRRVVPARAVHCTDEGIEGRPEPTTDLLRVSLV